MRLTNKTERWSMGGKRFVGKYKGFECNINFQGNYYNNNEPYWYFYCDNDKLDIGYNSLWESLKYSSKEECHDACIKWIDEELKKGVKK